MGRGPYWNESWNPVSGCTPISEGCRNCWARAMLTRFGSKGGEQRGAVVLHHDRLGHPLRWCHPRTIAVNFLGDLFHEDVPDKFVGDVFGVIGCAKHHRFLLLTKRPERARSLIRRMYDERNIVIGNRLSTIRSFDAIWLGVSVEDQRTADERIPLLLDTPAEHRWLSLEPQIGPVKLAAHLYEWEEACIGDRDPGHPEERTPRIEWIVQGCESGPQRRPFDLDWARSVRDECARVGVPYFLKQIQEGRRVVKEPTLDGRQLLDVPFAVNVGWWA